MPCYSGDENSRGSGDREAILEETIDKRNAMMCAVFRAAGVEDILGKIDYKEAGISRKEFELWWKEHEEEDRLRREREKKAQAAKRAAAKAKAERAKKRKEVLAKLTDEDKIILGV